MNKKLIYIPQDNVDIALKSITSAIFYFFILGIILVGFFLSTHIYYNVKGTSMEPNILQETITYNGDACYVAKNIPYSYGDIIVAEKNNTQDVVKRIIAMGGDKIGYYFNKRKLCLLQLPFSSCKQKRNYCKRTNAFGVQVS